MNLLSETLEEVMGFYTPGGVAVITANPAFPSGSTHIHEMAHRRLCENSAFGMTTQLIALAMGERAHTDRVSSLTLMLRECVENSWLCHEGYAVWMQIVQTMVEGEPDMFDTVVRSLPPRYRAAASTFAIDPHQLLAHTSPDLDMKGRWMLVGVMIETAATILAYSAMAGPLLANLQAGETLTNIAVTQALRVASPDVRLQKLVACMTPQKVAAWTRSVMPVAQSAVSLQQQVEVYDKLVAAECEEAGLEFESVDVISSHAPSLMARLDVSRPLHVKSGLEGTVAESNAEQSASHAVSPIKIVPITVPDIPAAIAMINSWREFISNLGMIPMPDDFRVVAELLGERGGKTLMLIHCYVRHQVPVSERIVRVPRAILEEFSRLRIDVETLGKRMLPDAAMHFGAIVVGTPTDPIYSLPHACAAPFTWVLQALSLDHDYSFSRLAEAADVHVIDSAFEHWRMATHLECLDATGCSWSSAMFEKICLHRYAFDPGRGITYARVGPDGHLNAPEPDLPRVTFSQACLVETLLVGANSRYLSRSSH